MNKDNNIIIYGSGVRCRRAIEAINLLNWNIECIVDSNSKKWGNIVCGYEVVSPAILEKMKYAPIVIAIADSTQVAEVREKLQQEYNYDIQNEITFTKLLDLMYLECMDMEQNLSRTTNDRKENSVLFECSDGLVLGGIEAWTQKVVEEIISAGCNNTYIISPEGEYDVPIALRNHMIYYKHSSNEYYDRDMIRDVTNKIVGNMPCTIITSHADSLLYIASLIKKRYPGKIKIISVIHGGTYNICDAYLEKDRYIDKYIGVSEDIRAILIQRGVSKERVAHMTCPVKCDLNLTRKYSGSHEPLKIGYAGRIVKKQKRADLIIKFIAELEKRRINYILEIAGDGEYKGDIEKYISENEISDKVRMLGKVDRNLIGEFWKGQDVCINLADYEGRSISIMEAMANGAVPVVTDTSGVKEDIVNEKSGFIVKIGNYVLMADIIEMLSEHKEIIPVIGQAAHDIICPKVQMKEHITFWMKQLSAINQ